MKENYPGHVTLIEVGPRDGFQFESKIVPTALKTAVIRQLVEAGLKEIQVASFVHPRRVPQMADAEAVIRQLPDDPGVKYSGLVLNRRGVERAVEAGIRNIEISISASDTHSRKNAGMGSEEALQQAEEMIRCGQEHGRIIRAGIQCVFGCV
jgi:hydroxymethylglutaryl-CoA lyase